MNTIEHRYDFCFLFDVKNGNPNGDPDAGNLPRMDPETGHGLVSDVCIKRKLRNAVSHAMAKQQGYEIFISQSAVLEALIDEAYTERGEKPKKGGTSNEGVTAARKYMCERYYDVRTFGAVMSTGANAGQVRGPVQITFSSSMEPIVPTEHTITRMAVATKKEATKEKGANRTMGRKSTVPYALYRGYGFISANFAAQTGFSEVDLDVFWQAMENMFEEDRSAARGLMALRKLIVFEHESKLGNAPAHTLLESIQVGRSTDGPARGFDEYTVAVPTSLPNGVTCHERV